VAGFGYLLISSGRTYSENNENKAAMNDTTRHKLHEQLPCMLQHVNFAKDITTVWTTEEFTKIYDFDTSFKSI